jgi:hypothetical protein
MRRRGLGRKERRLRGKRYCVRKGRRERSRLKRGRVKRGRGRRWV